MAEEKAPAAAVAESQEKRASISDYLQVPRKKRKNYIILAFKKGFDEDLHSAIKNYCIKTYPAMAVAEAHDIKGLRRMYNRNIVILLIDDELTNESADVLKAVHDLKIKRKSEKIPVLFFTRNPDDLILEYHKELLPFHEVDEYMQYTKLEHQQVIGRVKIGVEQQNKRKSRRYKANIPVSFFHLGKNETLPARIVDMSVHGVKLKANADVMFKANDQIKLNIPVSQYLGPDFGGDFLKISGKVRRVFLSGSAAAVSFEYLSDVQFLNITKLVTRYVNQQMAIDNKKSGRSSASLG